MPKWNPLLRKFDKLNPDLFSRKFIIDNFHLKKEAIQPYDTLICWDTIWVGEDLVYEMSFLELWFGSRWKHLGILASMLELINLIEAAVIFEHIVAPMRKVETFNLSYSKNALTRYLVDEGILRTTWVDDISSTHPTVRNLQADMYATLFQEPISPLDIHWYVGGTLYDVSGWARMIVNMYDQGYDWIINESLRSRGVDGDPGFAEMSYLDAIYLYSISKILNISFQPNIVHYPLHDLLLNQWNNYKLPAAYAELVKMARIRGFGKFGYSANLTIPPISSYVLSGRGKVSDIIKRLTTIRNKFASFRQRFREYQFALDNQNEFDPDRMAKYRKYYWDGLISDIESVGRGRGSFLHVLEPISANLIYKTDGVSHEVNLSLSGLINALAQGFSLVSFSSHVKLLTNLYKSAVNLPEHPILTRHLVSHQDLNAFRSFLKKYRLYLAEAQGKSSFIFPDPWM